MKNHLEKHISTSPDYFGPVDQLELAAVKQIYQSGDDLTESINWPEKIKYLADQLGYQPRYYNPDNLDKKIRLAHDNLTQSAQDKPIDLALHEYEQGQTEPLDFRLTNYAKSGDQYSPTFQQVIDFWHHKENFRWIARENWEKFCQFMHCESIPKNLKRCYALFHLHRHLFYNYSGTYPQIECYVDPDYLHSHQLPSLPQDYPIQSKIFKPKSQPINHNGDMVITETPITIEKKLLDLHFSQEETDNIIKYFEKQWHINPTSH